MIAFPMRCLFVVCIMAAPLGAEPWRSLLDRDLGGWRHWVGRPHASVVLEGMTRDDSGKYLDVVGWDRDPLGIYRVVMEGGEPILMISGQVFGSIVTTESFRNYHLRLEYKWGRKRWPPRSDVVRDSGLLYHVYRDPGTDGKTWPPSVELQIQEGDTGDLWAIQSQISVRQRREPRPEGKFVRIYDPAGAAYSFSQDAGIDSRCIKGADFEKSTGEWNTVELICIGDESIHIVNGHVVMRLRALKGRGASGWEPLTSGRIALQSEGAEIVYRRIAIRAITAVPEAYVDGAE